MHDQNVSVGLFLKERAAYATRGSIEVVVDKVHAVRPDVDCAVGLHLGVDSPTSHVRRPSYDLGMVTRPSGRDGHEIVEVGPETCINGHRLVYPNVLIQGSANTISWTCRTCGDRYTEHRGGTVTRSQVRPF